MSRIRRAVELSRSSAREDVRDVFRVVDRDHELIREHAVPAAQHEVAGSARRPFLWTAHEIHERHAGAVGHA